MVAPVSVVSRVYVLEHNAGPPELPTAGLYSVCVPLGFSFSTRLPMCVPTPGHVQASLLIHQWNL